FGASRFRDNFYRPDIVAKVLEAKILDEEKAAQKANEETGRSQETPNVLDHLPAVIQITSPRDGSDAVTNTIQLGYTLRTPLRDPVKGLSIYIDGRPYKTKIIAMEPNKEVTGTIDV